jgi:hypothetical protein
MTGFCLLALTTLAPPSIGQPSALFLAIAWKDGLLLPFAIHDGAAWWNPWPVGPYGSLADVPLPASIEETPTNWLPPRTVLRRRWVLWSLDAGTQRALQVTGFERSNSVMDFIGLRSDMAVRSTGSRARHEWAGETGVAVAGSATIGRFVKLDEASEDWQTLAPHMKSRLEAAETAAIADWIEDRAASPDAEVRTATHPITAAERASTPLHVDLFRAVMKEAGRTFYYFSASKRYEGTVGRRCSPVTEFDGIVTLQDTRLDAIKSLSAFATDTCAVGTSLTPLATLHWHGPSLWIVRGDAEDGFEYGLLDPNAADPHLLFMKGPWQSHGPHRQ